MTISKTIQLLIFSGDPNGMVMSELSNWNGRLYKISRNELSEFSTRVDREHTGVYFLFGVDDDLNETLYIGESEKIYSRLKQHLNDQNYWNECVVVISKDNVLNKAHIKYIEHKFYNLAKESGKSVVLNSSIPSNSSISEYDESMIEEFIFNVKLLTSTLGYKSFDIVEPEDKHVGKSNQVFQIIAARGAEAKGMIIPEGFAVLKDSKIANNIAPSMSESLIKLRQKIISKGIVNQDGVFIQDYAFTSPSLAAAIVMGRNANGRTEWKNTAGMSIKEVEEYYIKVTE